MAKPRIKSREVIASSKPVRSRWVRVGKCLNSKVKQVFCYNSKGVNLKPIK